MHKIFDENKNFEANRQSVQDFLQIIKTCTDKKLDEAIEYCQNHIADQEIKKALVLLLEGFENEKQSFYK